MIGSIFLILSIAFISGLIIFLLTRRTKNTLLFILLIHLICTEMWLVGTLQMFLHADDILAVEFWDRFVYAGVTLLPAILFHFTAVFVQKLQKYKKELYAFYILSFVFLILSRFSIFVDGVFIYEWGAHTQAQIAHHFFLVFFLVVVMFSLSLLFQYYKDLSDPIEKERAKYVFFSFLSLYGIGSFAYLPAYNISIYPIPFISGVFIFSFLTYAITRYRLLNLQVVIKRSVIYIIAFILVATAVIGLTIWLVNNVAEQNYLLFIYVTLVILLLFYPIRGFIQRYFWKRQYNFAIDEEEMAPVDKYLINYFEPLHVPLSQRLDIDLFYIYAVLPDENMKVFEMQYPMHNSRDYFEFSHDIIYTLKTKMPILYCKDKSTPLCNEVKPILNHKKCDYFITLAFENEMLGFIVLKLNPNEKNPDTMAILKKYQEQFSQAIHLALKVKYIQRIYRV